jgi:hypothetical protein
LILREDQLLAKAHRLRAKKKDKEELDPFAPEYGEDTWHQVGWRPWSNQPGLFMCFINQGRVMLLG